METNVITIPERRRASRIRSAHGILAARVRSGRAVAIVDVSAGGALVDTATRLLPGAPVDVHLERAHDNASCRGQVTRCAIVRLKAAVVHYRAAIAFDKPLLWFQSEQSDGYLIPARKPSSDHPRGVDPTHSVV
jgi:hypothetical protein